MLMTDLHNLTDDALIEKIDRLARASRESTAELIAHLVELEERDLHLALGFKSLFGYCRRVLHCSEAGSYDRMQAAHAAARFPVVLAMLAEGLLHLTAVRLLAPHLKDEDHLALLCGAIHKSGREVRALLARWFPRADVAGSIRKLPESRRAGPGASTATTPAAVSFLPSAPTAAELMSAPASASGDATNERDATPPARRPTITPLAPRRYAIQFTGDEEMAALVQEARELLSHSIPPSDLAAIFKRAMSLLVAEARRSRFAATGRPGAARPIARDSRAVPADVQRAVWDRDGGQCSFVGSTGRRCEERCYLDYHHLTPWIVGGTPTVENVALRCRAHNQYEARRFLAPVRKALAQATVLAT